MITTDEAIFTSSFGDHLAVSDFTCHAMFHILAVQVISTTRTSIFFSNVSPTETAVHSARRNQFYRNCSSLFFHFFCRDLCNQFGSQPASLLAKSDPLRAKTDRRQGKTSRAYSMSYFQLLRRRSLISFACSFPLSLYILSMT